jgi:hypothetical protein
MDEEVGIYREEVILIMGALADLRHDTGMIIRLLVEEDGTEEEEEDDA